MRALRPRRGGRLPLALLAVVCAAGVTAAVSDASAAPNLLRFAQTGHWIAQPEKDTVFHVNGAAGTVDARVGAVQMDPGSQGTQVVEGPTSGYVISRDRVTQFGKSTLRVEGQFALPAEPTGELPVALEADGGPYLVYRELGTVTRIGGEDPVVMAAGGSLAAPVVTPDGTVWLLRRGDNVLCRVTPPGVGAGPRDGRRGGLLRERPEGAWRRAERGRRPGRVRRHRHRLRECGDRAWSGPCRRGRRGSAGRRAGRSSG